MLFIRQVIRNIHSQWISLVFNQHQAEMIVFETTEERRTVFGRKNFTTCRASNPVEQFERPKTEKERHTYGAHTFLPCFDSVVWSPVLSCPWDPPYPLSNPLLQFRRPTPTEEKKGSALKSQSSRHYEKVIDRLLTHLAFDFSASWRNTLSFIS